MCQPAGELFDTRSTPLTEFGFFGRTISDVVIKSWIIDQLGSGPSMRSDADKKIKCGMSQFDEWVRVQQRNDERQNSGSIATSLRDVVQ